MNARSSSRCLVVAVIAAISGFTFPGATQSVQLTSNTGEEIWRDRDSTTVNGQVLWVDGDGAVVFFNGATTNLVQAQEVFAVGETAFALGSGAAVSQVIAVWRRGTDAGWVSINGDPPVPVTATNPINPGNEMNLEGVAIADGSVFVILQAGNSKHVFRIDPFTGQGTLLTNGDNVPGANGVRLSASGGQAVWPFQSVDQGPYALHFFNGNSVQVLEPAIEGNAHLSRGRIVYLKNVGGVNQVFLFDSTQPGASPVQLSFDADGVNSHPRTDGGHVAWKHTAPGASGSDIMLAGGVRLNAADEQLPNDPGDFREHPFQLHRGQLLWRDVNGRLLFHAAGRTRALEISPATTYAGTTSAGSRCCTPWLGDGSVALNGLSNDGGADREVFLLSVEPPADSQQPLPPLSLRASAVGSEITLSWDSVMGASGYHLYVAYDPAVTMDNFSTLAGGRRIANVTSPYVLSGVSNRIHFLAVSAVANGIEGPSSASVAVALWASAVVGPAGNVFALATGRTNGALAYAASGNAVYRSADAGANWSVLAGGIQSFDVRGLAVDGPRVYAATRDVFGAGPAKILRSLNSGADWSEVVPDGGMLGEGSKTLVIDPLTPSQVYAANVQLPTMNEPDDSFVIVTTNGGDGWEHLPEATEPLGAEIRAYALAIDPINPSILYAGGSGTPNLARSMDGGATWANISPGTGFIRAIAIDPVQPQTIFVSAVDFTQTSLGVFKSTNRGDDWTASQSGFPVTRPRINTLFIDPLNPQQIHAGTDEGHFLSLDGGLYWSRVDRGLPNPSAQAINAFAVTETRQLLAATAAGIYRLDLSTMNLALPALAISRSGGNAVISWPVAAADFSLQSAGNIPPESGWQLPGLDITVVNGSNTVTVGTSDGPRFFRLVKP